MVREGLFEKVTAGQEGERLGIAEGREQAHEVSLSPKCSRNGMKNSVAAGKK